MPLVLSSTQRDFLRMQRTSKPVDLRFVEESGNFRETTRATRDQLIANPESLTANR